MPVGTALVGDQLQLGPDVVPLGGAAELLHHLLQVLMHQLLCLRLWDMLKQLCQGCFWFAGIDDYLQEATAQAASQSACSIIAMHHLQHQ